MHAVDVTPARDEDVDHSDEISCQMIVFDAVVADFLLSISSGVFVKVGGGGVEWTTCRDMVVCMVVRYVPNSFRQL
ncbi:hypothetical protein M405DRAFT_802984 [Rhizopogon salebrosus TDB-379]|nr:hypothetical protein M405DRAFT_802984 [Rhizopogon salebrosus TDB-379]